MYSFDNFAKACRKAIPEGITLLEHDGALPFSNGERVALFGRGQFEYIKSGTGSGGRVNCPYVTSVGEELSKRVTLDEEVLEFFRKYVEENPYDNGTGWFIPASQKQPLLDEDFVKKAASRNDKAVFMLCRTVGESFDCNAQKGEWYLSDAEEQNIEILSKHFKHLIVLINSGNLIDMTWVKKYNVGTVVCIWQGGQEGGRGTVDVLMGDAFPSGRLADTIADSIDTYPSTACFGNEVENFHKEDIYVGYRYFQTFAPEHVLYPFGYGLGYTEFETKVISAKLDENLIKLSVLVKNIGNFAGKEVIQVYSSAPCGKLGKPARELIAFNKTDTLDPNEEQTIEFTVALNDLASYDDSGVSGFEFSYVLEAGNYNIYVGKNVRDALLSFSFDIPSTRLVRKCTQALAPTVSFERMTTHDGATPTFEPAPLARYDIDKRISCALPEPIELTGDRGIVLKDVAEGKNTLDEFIAQFSPDDLMLLVRGEGMSSPKSPIPGTASSFGGVTRVWQNKGVPVITTCDGPSGIRMESNAIATCIPTGALLASAWSPKAFHDLFDCFADELLHYDVDIVLAPGMNIHRNPLCGRNFEYFSEDPVLTGNYATMIAERMTKKGIYCTLKHFAVNSQETNRRFENEILSERALREIYLKGFEIAVRSGYVKAIMTSYNVINGFSAGGCYDLTTTILRNEWGYDSFVMTDWWPSLIDTHTNTNRPNNSTVMIKAQNDIYMCVADAILHDDDLKSSFEEGYLTLGELQRCAKNLVRFAISSLAFRSGRTNEIESLYDYNERVFDIDLTSVPAFEYELPEKRYRVIPRKKITPSVEEDGFYCAELSYIIEGDSLVQHTYKVYLDSNEPMRIVCSGTDGKEEKLRFKLYLKRDSVIYFESDCLTHFSLYKI